MAEKRLYDLAKVIRSKNSGPFSITLDALFSDAKVYYGIKKSGVITREKIAEIYQLKPQMIMQLVFLMRPLALRSLLTGKFLPAHVWTRMCMEHSSTPRWGN